MTAACSSAPRPHGSRRRAVARLLTMRIEFPDASNSALILRSACNARLEGWPRILTAPSAKRQSLAHMLRHGRGGDNWRLVLGNRHHDFARVQVKDRSSRPGCATINIIADNRPAHLGRMHPQLM